MGGLFSRLRAAIAPPLETRDAASMSANFGAAFGISETGGRFISPVAAENLASIASAVSAISGAVASLQPLAFRRDGAGRAELPNPHWLPRLLRQPAPRTSWFDWIETQVSGVLLAGNAVAVIEHDGGGRVIALHPISWSACSMVRLASQRVAYDVTDTRGTWGRPNAVHRFFEDQIWHLADRRDPGELAARPRLGRVGGAIANALSLQDMASAAWRNATFASGYIAVPAGGMTKELRLEADSYLERFKGATNAGRTPLLPAGWRWESMNIDAGSLQALESRKFSVIEVARAFNIPPPLLQSYENNTFTNAAQASLWFAQFTLGPWVRKIESAMQVALLGAQSDLSLELDLASLQRGDHAERWAANKIAIETGVLTIGEVRQQEGWPPLTAPAAPPPSPPATQEGPAA